MNQIEKTKVKETVRKSTTAGKSTTKINILKRAAGNLKTVKSKEQS